MCREVGRFGVLYISGGNLVRGCAICKTTDLVPLPRLKKTILYLDQFFLSAAFREKQPTFVEAMNRVSQLAAKQLLVCPWSDVHETETHQWKHSEQQALWAFIKRAACGHKFSHSASLKYDQLAAAFCAFIDGRKRENQSLDICNAFHGDIHGWDDAFWIDVRSHAQDVDAVRSSKELGAAGMANLFDAWRSSPASFSDALHIECSGYAQFFLDQYVTFLKETNDTSRNMSIESILGNWGAQVVSRLLLELDRNLSFENRFPQVVAFFRSSAFREAPHVDASCRVMASLRKAVQNGEMPTRHAAEKAMLGFGQDLEVVSVFAPYADGIFVDRAMHRWVTDAECGISDRHRFKAFSASSWDSFFEYLDAIDANQPPNHDRWLRAVYG